MSHAISGRAPELNLRYHQLSSRALDRKVKVDFYFPRNITGTGELSLLLFNDGQLLNAMNLYGLLEDLNLKKRLSPLLIAGIHAGPERRQEYGIAGIPDFAGRGSKAEQYAGFILEEMLPCIQDIFGITGFAEKSFAGFSLGGLSALDMVWNYPGEFSTAGVFSGSLWWRTRDLDNGYVESRDRIMHNRIREGGYVPGTRFYFQCGTEDELMDRNGNGIIDSVNDTEDLIRELEARGYRQPQDIRYLLVQGGKHHETTWASVLPDFLSWGWGTDPPVPGSG